MKKNLFNSKLLYNNVIYNITKALQLKKDNNYIFEIFFHNLSFLNYLHPDQNTCTTHYIIRKYYECPNTWSLVDCGHKNVHRIVNVYGKYWF